MNIDEPELTAEEAAQEEKELDGYWLYFKAMSPGATVQDKLRATLAWMELASDADDAGMPLLFKHRIDKVHKIMGGRDKVLEMVGRINAN